MTERLLQFIWQYQYFNKNELACTTGEAIEIILPGRFNTNQGPDFSEAKIRIGNTLWAGTVELHINTSAWEKHRHQYDSNYRNVILHVVWEDDNANSFAPVLELRSRVPKILLQRYEQLTNSLSFIPCEKSITTVKTITWHGWKDRLLAERLLRKTAIIENYLSENNHHWEETFWWLLARNYGMKVNADAFEVMARSLAPSILARHKNQLPRLEALLFGQAGLLRHRFREEYPRWLQKEYRFLKRKYGLSPIPYPIHFLRMRPGNFPTIRIAQLAGLLHKSMHLFSLLKETGTVKEIKKIFETTAGEYWNSHYRFDEISGHQPKKPGMDMIENILINTLVPVLFAYGHYHNDQQYKDRALQWLEETAAENNSIIRRFQQCGIQCSTAYDSQALIELKSRYCDEKKCLDCAIGNCLVSPEV